jgi:hypothetical protein
MNHRGSLAYYPAAVVCGGFFLSVCYYPYVLLVTRAPSAAWARGFLFVCFFALLLGAVPLLIWAAVLRWLARRQGWRGATEWMAAGVALFALEMGALGILVKLLTPVPFPRWAELALGFLLAGPRFVVKQPLWLPFPGAVATAYVLSLVHRAFEPKTRPTAESSPS